MLSVQILLLMVAGVSCMMNYSSVKCPEDCSRVMCIKHKILKRRCGEAGTVYGTCGCCQICAKNIGQICGGKMDAYGRCGIKSYCHKPVPGDGIGSCQPSLTMSVKIEEVSRRVRDGNNGVSVLYKESKMCQPKCTYEYCSKYPDATCSASGKVVLKRGCQGKCQHTNCQACYFKTKRESPCPKCGHDDFECMKRFAKCVHEETCTKHKYPCQANQKRKSDGRFVCKVPACS